MDLSDLSVSDTPTAAIVEAIVEVIDHADQVDLVVLADLLSRCETLNEFQLLQAASSLLQAAIAQGEGMVPERGKQLRG